MSGQETVLELEGVNFGYGGAPAITDASIRVLRGDFIGIIGPNGAGKTTLVKIMLGLLKPESGKVRIFGKEGLAGNGRIGYVPQRTGGLDKDFPATVLEVAMMGLVPGKGMFNRFNAEDMKKAEECLGQVGMLGYKDRRIGDLSGGQQQKAFIARAMAGDPEMLILDEPTVGVDAESQEAFYSILRRLNKRGMTIILISHDTGAISRNVRRVACVNRNVVMHEASDAFGTGMSCAYDPAEMKGLEHRHGGKHD